MQGPQYHNLMPEAGDRRQDRVRRTYCKPQPNHAKYQAIGDFPAPENIKELRSYMGLANQLSFFISDLQQCTANMRKLMSPKNEYIWAPTQDEEFRKLKDILLSTKMVQPFNPKWMTAVLTDASRLNGIGFASRPDHLSHLLPPVSPSFALQPMRRVSLDLFAAAGQDWLAMVDRYSGYAWTSRLSSTTTRHVLSQLETWYTDFGWPLINRSEPPPTPHGPTPGELPAHPRQQHLC